MVEKKRKKKGKLPFGERVSQCCEVVSGLDLYQLGSRSNRLEQMRMDWGEGGRYFYRPGGGAMLEGRIVCGHGWKGDLDG